jgi:hypothetical protein
MKVVKIKNYIHLQFELNLFAPFNFFSLSSEQNILIIIFSATFAKKTQQYTIAAIKK